MTEVGDHQSLVASLKQAAYFHLFKVMFAQYSPAQGFIAGHTKCSCLQSSYLSMGTAWHRYLSKCSMLGFI